MTSELTDGERTWWVAEAAVFVIVPDGLIMACDELGRDVDAAVGHGVVSVEDLQCIDRVHLADGERHVVGRLPLRGRREQARRLAREVETGVLPEAEGLHLVQQPLLP